MATRDYSEFGWVESALYDDMGYGLPSEFQNDRIAQALYDNALFNFDLSSQDARAIKEALNDYMRDNYGVEFDDVFNWEGYREAYDSVGF